jgi:hypothetical protein
MLRFEVRKCKKCHQLYRWSGGGIVMRPEDFDFGLCPRCRKESGMAWVKDNDEEPNRRSLRDRIMDRIFYWMTHKNN